MSNTMSEKKATPRQYIIKFYNNERKDSVKSPRELTGFVKNN